ncbi:hypothetical protein BC938DRAFT_476406 [Jimgerdemannia flammicorona]|uniref:Dephospho-CoA kinase n=1 Tax=Jimgerdemannia flammicorona TaxID=994334 RepID=A0A433PHD2_9FUNG|nr:hypothetical protein BC938DRAFT_476406 [Jimgerdemannia flammicorona]
MRDSLSDAEATQRIRAQIPLGDKARRATYVIDNSGELEETERQVLDLARKIQPDMARWMLEWVGPPLILAAVVGWFLYGLKKGYMGDVMRYVTGA